MTTINIERVARKIYHNSVTYSVIPVTWDELEDTDTGRLTKGLFMQEAFAATADVLFQIRKSAVDGSFIALYSERLKTELDSTKKKYEALKGEEYGNT